MVDEADARQTRLMHGVLDMCVLAVIDQHPTHAYAVVQQLREHGFDRTSYGSIYPLTTRLTKAGLIEKTVADSSLGPSRNILSSTPEGKKMLGLWQREWEATSCAVRNLMNSSTAITEVGCSA